MGRIACTVPQCLYNGAPLPLSIPLLALWAAQPVQSLSACTTVHLYLYLYLYSPYGPYSLYRASVPVQGCTFTYTSTPPMGRTASTEPQCLYKGAPLPLPIPLLPLWTLRPVQSLSACTKAHLYLYLYHYSPYVPYGLYRASVPVQGCTFTFTYTSTPPMDRTAFTEPQFLYNGALYLLPFSILYWFLLQIYFFSLCRQRSIILFMFNDKGNVIERYNVKFDHDKRIYISCKNTLLLCFITPLAITAVTPTHTSRGANCKPQLVENFLDGSHTTIERSKSSGHLLNIAYILLHISHTNKFTIY